MLIDQDKCRGWRLTMSTVARTRKSTSTGRAVNPRKCIFCYPRIESGQPTVCSKPASGAFAISACCCTTRTALKKRPAPSTKTDLYRHQCDVFLNPHDPAVIEALKQGIPANAIEAAQKSPVYKMAMDWKLALPLPEYRTHPADGLARATAVTDSVLRGCRRPAAE